MEPRTASGNSPNTLTKDPTLRSKRRRSWPARIGIVLGGTAITVAILWATGLTSQVWWLKLFANKPQPLAIALPALPARPVAAPPPAPRGNDSSISAKTLSLILVQTNPGRNAHEGTAQIGVVRESPQTYQAGAVLENGAHLAEIHADYVLLEKDGRSARLYMQTPLASSLTKPSPLLSVGGVKHSPSPPSVMSREILTAYIRPSPVYNGGNLVGYQVYAGATAGPFAEMGLHAGDVITSMAGTQLNDPLMAWELFRQVAGGAVLSAVVKREEVFRDITLDGTLILRAQEAKAERIQGTMLAAESP